MRTSQLLALTVALATSTMANPVPQVDNKEANVESGHVRVSDARDDPSGCTTTIPQMPQFTWGPTRTIWTTTTTSTRYMDCGPCTAVARTEFPIGPGPVVFFTATTTVEEPWTTTALACAVPTAAPDTTPAP